MKMKLVLTLSILMLSIHLKADEVNGEAVVDREPSSVKSVFTQEWLDQVSDEKAILQAKEAQMSKEHDAFLRRLNGYAFIH